MVLYERLQAGVKVRDCVSLMVRDLKYPEDALLSLGFGHSSASHAQTWESQVWHENPPGSPTSGSDSSECRTWTENDNCSVLQLDDGENAIALACLDEEYKCAFGFMCKYDAVKRTFYASPTNSLHNYLVDEERSTKGALTALLDFAEACNMRRVTVGLGPEHAACQDFVCAMLYLGFQVSNPRKAPFQDAVLLMDLNLGWSDNNSCQSSDYHTDEYSSA